MNSPRWSKVVRDIMDYRARSCLLVVALLLGVLAVGIVLNALNIMEREIDRNYLGTNPASVVANVKVDDPKILPALRASPLIADVEPRGAFTARMQLSPNRWITARLFVIEDFGALQAHAFKNEAGSYPPSTGEIVLERSALSLTERVIGEAIELKWPAGRTVALEIVGTVHDPGLAPAWMEGLIYGYVNADTARELGASTIFNRIFVNASNNPTNRKSNELVANEVRSILDGLNSSAEVVQAQGGDEHPHQDQFRSLVFLLKAFGVMTALLSGLLVSTVIGGHMAEQRSQIAIMKAIGAVPSQITGIYVLMVGLLGLVAALIAMPLARLGANAYVDWAMRILNFEVESYSVASWVWLSQLGAAVFLPVVASVWPISKTTRATIRESLNLNVTQSISWHPLMRVFSKLQQVSLPGLFALRNSIRRPGRLLSSVTILTIGGAMFISALSIRDGWLRTVDESNEARNYDLALQLAAPYERARILDALANVPSIDDIELWQTATLKFALQHNPVGEGIRVLVVPVNSSMLELPLAEGGWLREGSGQEIVVTERLLRQIPEFTVGSILELDSSSDLVEWRVIGVARDIVMAGAYVSRETLRDRAGESRDGDILVVRSSDADATNTQKRIEVEMLAAGIEIQSARTTDSMYQSLIDHVAILTNLLLLVSMLVAVVGGLGLMAAITLNTLERTREIGVLRTIGASRRQVIAIICGEAWVLGGVSWLLATMLAIPLTLLVGSISGTIFVGSPIVFVMPSTVIVTWALIVFIIASLACYPAARRATKWQIHKTLSYSG